MILRLPGWPLVALILLLLAGPEGHSREVQVEAGQCRFSVERDGVFFQADKHTDNYMRPACASIAFADSFERWPGLGWRAWFMKTGDFAARGNEATTDEAAHSAGTCDLDTGNHCLYRFDGSGSMKGVGVSLTGAIALSAHWSLIAEGGLMFFKSSFTVTITPLNTNDGVKRGEEHSKWTDFPVPMLGITLRRDRPLGLPFSVYAAARHYWPAEHRALNLGNAHTDFMLGAAKEF